MTNEHLSTAEVPAETERPFVVSANELIERSSHQEPLERLEALKHFTDSIFEAAEQESIRNSSGEVYTAEILESNFSLMLELFDKPQKNVDPLLRVPRSDGLRASFAGLLTTEATAQNFIDALSISLAERKERAQQTLTRSRAVGHVATEAASRIETEENNESKRWRDLFPPEVRPEVPDATIDRYDVMLEQDPIKHAALSEALQREDEARRPLVEAQQKYDSLVNDETRNDAREQLELTVSYDPQIKRILEDFHLDTASLEAVDAIRTNAEVRAMLAEYLNEKMDDGIRQDPGGFGWRLVENSPNNLKTNPKSNRKMLSRHYAVDLALKMLGGSFDRKQEANDYTENEQGRVINGQHRHAARYLLGTRY